MINMKVQYNNKIRLLFFIGALLFLLFASIVFPLMFLNYFSFSGVSQFLKSYIGYSVIPITILAYFFIAGQYYYKIYIDAYIVQVVSYRPILHFFRKKDFIDIPHSLLIDFSFFNRPISFNKILMLRIRTEKGKVIVKRFNVTLIRKGEINRITRFLNKIINANN